MKQITWLKSLLIIVLLVSGIKSYSQSRSSLSFGYGINKPYSGDYKFGKGVQLQGNISVAHKWAVSPIIGYDRLLSNVHGIYGPTDYYSNRIDNIDLMYLGISARYTFNNQWFAKAGPLLYAAGANEDLANLDIGGAAAVGYTLNFTNHSTLELSLSTEMVNIPPQAGKGTTPIAGLKIAYMFNFKQLK